MPDGAAPPLLRIPQIFYGLEHIPEIKDLLNRLIRTLGDVSQRHSQWYIADNLVTYGHTAGFRFDPRFVAAVEASQPKPMERSLAWRTHTLCWAAASCQGLDGDYVECGTYEGYSMEVVLRYLDGLSGRNCWFYDVFDPSGTRAYVANNKTNDVSVIDTQTLKEIGRIEAGVHPDGIAFLPAG